MLNVENLLSVIIWDRKASRNVKQLWEKQHKKIAWEKKNKKDDCLTISDPGIN